MVKLTENEKGLLQNLCRCIPNKGLVLKYRSEKIIAASLIKKGLAWSIGSGFFTIYLATDDGREWLDKS